MSESTLTPEQANELGAKQILADALDDIRKHANSARNKAQEIIYALEEVIKAIPDGVTADNLDLDSIGVALNAAREADVEASDTNGLRRAIEQMEGDLAETGCQFRYLMAGDFRDDLA